MKQIFTLTSYGQDYKIRLDKNSYSNNNSLAISMEVIYESGEVEPWDVLTTNLPESKSDNDCLAFVNNDKYGEFLRKNNIAKPTGIIAYSGFNTYTEYDFTEFLKK